METVKPKRKSSFYVNLCAAILSLLVLAALEALATVAVLRLAVHH